MGPPYGKRDPYYSHIFRDPKLGVVCRPEWSPRGPMSLGVPGKNSLMQTRISEPWSYVQGYMIST